MNKFGMSGSVISSLMVALMLTACKSTPMEDAAPVVDKAPVQEAKKIVDKVMPSANTQAIKSVDIGNGNNRQVYDYVNPLNDPANILSHRSVYFDYNSDVVKTEFRSMLEAHAQYLNDSQGAKIRILGNTDDRGTREYNLSLGQRRSVAVRKTLNLLGVSDAQIETVSYGEENANTSCADDGCYAADRRADIVYTSEY